MARVVNIRFWFCIGTIETLLNRDGSAHGDIHHLKVSIPTSRSISQVAVGFLSQTKALFLFTVTGFELMSSVNSFG